MAPHVFRRSCELRVDELHSLFDLQTLLLSQAFQDVDSPSPLVLQILPMVHKNDVNFLLILAFAGNWCLFEVAQLLLQDQLLVRPAVFCRRRPSAQDCLVVDCR